jgi:2-oxoglutarate dehydrogenase E2 component (dihydrolipoamide succinyltransferase)
MPVEVRIPSLGESVSEGEIARWLKKDGDTVAPDDVLFELETDKATMEIAAETAGRLQILKPEGSKVEVGTVVARIVEGDGKVSRPAEAAEKPSPPAPAAKAADAKAPAPKAEKPEPQESESEEGTPALSPAVRKLVAENHLDPATISGTGKGGRVTKEDVLRAIEAKKETKPAESPATAKGEGEAPAEPRPAPSPPHPSPLPKGERGPEAEKGEGADVERVPMTRLRKRIAERLVEAQRTAAILTTFNEIDMSAVMALRKRYKERFEKAHGVGLGFMSLFARACVLALHDIRIVNASIDGDEIVYHRHVHLGIAVGTSRGLVVPVVRNADTLSIAGLEKAIGELAALARDSKLLPDHLAGGTFTISNGGVYGSLMSTPILTPPQAAILGMHKIEERAVVVDGQIVARPMMYVALSYDHRLIDGEQAVTFLVRVKERLEDPTRMVLEV